MGFEECRSFYAPYKTASASDKLVPYCEFEKLNHWDSEAKAECLTCWCRRVECDQSKVSLCQRCKLMYRPCERIGKQYARAAVLYGRRKSVRLNDAISHIFTPVGVCANARERQVFDLLRSLTLKQITGPFNPSFWSIDILRAAETYPVIFHVSLALAALNHRMRIGHIDNESGRDYHIFALRQSNLGILKLIQLMQKPRLSYEDKEAILLASVLFTGTSCLQRNLNQALMHVKKALQLFLQWRFWLETVTASPQTIHKGVVDPKWLLHFISYFEFQAHEIDSSIAVQSWGCSPYDCAWKEENREFASVAEAYYEYMPLHFGSASRLGGALERQIGLKQNGMASFDNIYGKWRLRFQQLERCCALPASSEERLGVAMLRLLVNCKQLCRYLLRNDRPEVWIWHEEQFSDIVDEAEKLLAEESKSAGVILPDPVNDGTGDGVATTFNFSLSAVEALRLVGFVCRKGSIRRRVLRLLRKHRRRDGLWDGELSAALIEARMLLEEKMMASNGDGKCCGCVVDVYACIHHRGRVVRSDMMGDKAFRASINCEEGQVRGDADGHALIRWD